MGGDQGCCPYAYRSLVNPHTHTGIAVFIMPICIWGCTRSPYAYGDWIDSRTRMEVTIYSITIRIWVSSQSPYAYWERRNHRMRMGIENIVIPICVRDSNESPYAYGDPRMHTGIFQSLTHTHIGSVRIWEIRFWTPYARISIWGSNAIPIRVQG